MILKKKTSMVDFHIRIARDDDTEIGEFAKEEDVTYSELGRAFLLYGKKMYKLSKDTKEIKPPEVFKNGS